MKIPMRKFFLLTTFLMTAPAVFCLVLLFFLFISYHSTPSESTKHTMDKKIAYAALPSNRNVLGVQSFSSHAEVELIRQFLERYNSPLEPYAEYFVVKAHEYGLDPRLLPAIAMQESTLCRKIPENSYNCWGFGIYGGRVTRFNDYGHAIDVISKTLGTKYKDKGLVTPDQIMTLYTPSNIGTWSANVTFFMEQMK